MKKEKAITSTEQLKAAIERVSFERSCLDMGWLWEIERVNELDSKHWHIRCSFQRPDRTTGEIGRGFGRWWVIESGATFSSVVKTMFAAAKMIVDHELMEAFKVDRRRPFDPHRTIAELTVKGRQ